MKYNEERIIEEISRYIKGTYGEHYSTTKDGFQVQDLLRHLVIDKDFWSSDGIFLVLSSIGVDMISHSISRLRLSIISFVPSTTSCPIPSPGINVICLNIFG